MADLADKLEALAPALDNLRNYQRQLDMDGCHVGVSRQALDEVLDAVERALRERDQAVEALRPFAEYGKWAVDENGWNLGSPHERLCDWFGPSDFHRAATTLASIEGAGHE